MKRYLVFASILLLMLGLNHFSENASLRSAATVVPLFGGSALCLVLFVRQEKRAVNPILDLTLLRSRPFLASNLFNVLIGIGLFAVFAFIPLYAVSVQHLTVMASGMILTPRSLGTIAASTITSLLIVRLGYRWPMILGLLITVLASLWMADEEFRLFQWFGIHLGVVQSLLILITVNGIAAGILLPPSNNACIELMPDRVATISGLRATFRSVGGVIGTSLVTCILHLSPSPATGFRIIFLLSGVVLLLAIPLVFLMPEGRNLKAARQGGADMT